MNEIGLSSSGEAAMVAAERKGRKMVWTPDMMLGGSERKCYVATPFPCFNRFWINYNLFLDMIFNTIRCPQQSSTIEFITEFTNWGSHVKILNETNSFSFETCPCRFAWIIKKNFCKRKQTALSLQKANTKRRHLVGRITLSANTLRPTRRMFPSVTINFWTTM